MEPDPKLARDGAGKDAANWFRFAKFCDGTYPEYGCILNWPWAEVFAECGCIAQRMLALCMFSEL